MQGLGSGDPLALHPELGWGVVCRASETSPLIPHGPVGGTTQALGLHEAR